MTAQTATEAVKSSLESGAETAAEIRARTGLPHEAVYKALVHLEAIGKARLMCARPFRGNTHVVWGAL